MTIIYQNLIDKAMLQVIKGALEHISKHHNKASEENSFFISFITSYPGVKISQALRNKYPNEMTIVLQHQFENLQLLENAFSITLYFGGVPENLTIPYNAINHYVDKAANFALNFHVDNQSFEEADSFVDQSLNAGDNSKVIFLDQFRNKKDQ